MILSIVVSVDMHDTMSTSKQLLNIALLVVVSVDA